MIKPDKLIESEVVTAFSNDPVLDSSRVIVSCEHGVVALRGAVQTHEERLLAGSDAADVVGVRRVDNELLVGPLGERMADQQVAEDCQQAIDAARSLPRGAVSVRVAGGWVVLTGRLRNRVQRLECERIVRRVPGVLGITVNIMIGEAPTLSEPGADPGDSLYS